MARNRRIGKYQAGELNLVAMIDVAFQLLSFFLITLVPHDVMAHMVVNRPDIKPFPDDTRPVPPPVALRITVFANGYTLNERLVSMEQMESQMRRLVGVDKEQHVLIQCMADSTHDKLVSALNLCAKLHLVNLSVVSSVE